jgi:hypothetical protein
MMTQALRNPAPRLLIAIAVALTLIGSLGACGTDEVQEQTVPETSAAHGEAEVEALIDRFMKARQAGLPADEFLSADAQAVYEEHSTGLWLYDDTLPGGPGGEYESFSIQAVDETATDTWKVELQIRVRWLGDAPPSEILEVLAVTPGVVVEARRDDDLDDDGLPLAVAETREKIYRAAVAHDYETLRSLVDPETFSYSFGESGDPIGYWREQEEAEVPILGDILTGVLHTRFGKTEDIFMWPSGAAKEPSEWTEADREAMREAGSTDEEIRLFEQYGGYTGWRAGIRANGTWLFFIAGD